MSFQGTSYHNHNHNHAKHQHQHHHQHHHGLYRTNDYYSPEYILESMVTPRHQEAYVTFNNGCEERVQEAPTRVRVVEYEYQSPPRARYEVCEEKVDREAEDFIKLEHSKFGY